MQPVWQDAKLVGLQSRWDDIRSTLARMSWVKAGDGPFDLAGWLLLVRARAASLLQPLRAQPEQEIPAEEGPAEYVDLIVRDAVGFPLRWRDRSGVLHAAEGADQVPGEAESFLMWTRCGRDAVPVEQAWSGRQPLTCRDCASIEQEGGRRLRAAEALQYVPPRITFPPHPPSS